jgi:hypothetical protein
MMGIRKISIVGCVLLAAVLMGVVGDSARGASEQGTGIQPVWPPAHADGGPVIRPQKWMTATAPTTADRASFENYERTVTQLAAANILRPQDVLKPLTDTDTQQRLARAKNLIGSQGALTGSWNWPDVQNSVRSFGTVVSLADGSLMMPDDDSAVAMYDQQRHALLLWPSQVRKLNDEEFASTLVHEATHRESDLRSGERSGLTQREINALCNLCADASLMYDFSSEALAFLNQGRWYAARGNEKLIASVRYDHDVLRLAVKAGSGRAEDLEAFGLKVRDYVRNEFMAVQQSQHKPVLKCGVPRVMRGPQKGDFFFPSDIAPEILVPLLDRIQ